MLSVRPPLDLAPECGVIHRGEAGDDPHISGYVVAEAGKGCPDLGNEAVKVGYQADPLSVVIIGYLVIRR